MNFEFLFPGNIEILRMLNELATSSVWFRSIAMVGAWRTDVIILGFVVLFFVLRMFVGTRTLHLSEQKQRLFDIFKLLTGTTIVYIVVEAIKRITSIPRPFLEPNIGIEAMRYYDSFNSFPSGHSAVLLFIALFTIPRSRSMGIFALIIAVYISLARVAVGVHYPLDVVAGWLVALAVYNLATWWSIWRNSKG